jgi:hypothetical protein
MSLFQLVWQVDVKKCFSMELKLSNEVHLTEIVNYLSIDTFYHAPNTQFLRNDHNVTFRKDAKV